MEREPALLWRFFDDLCRIPRGSGNEGGVRAYIRGYAGSHGLGYLEDSAGNCLVSAPGRGAGAGAPPVIIQSHMDMVCVKNDENQDHDFTRDPIRTRVTTWTEKGSARDVLMGTGTTLGADNGIGLVAGLAVAADPNVADCPPLDLLFTVEEETGLTGARLLDPALLRADLLINLDSEELGDICVSCAGGRDLMADWKLRRETPAAGELPIRLYVTGLPGGHSGVQIHERRGNAILMLLQSLLAVKQTRGRLKLAVLSGGTARNVIPGHAEILLWASPADTAILEAAFRDPALTARIAGEVEEDEIGAAACGAERCEPGNVPWPIATAQTRDILDALAAIPNGVQQWSKVVEGLVETSNNAAVLTPTDDTLHLQCSTRSSSDGAIEEFQQALQRALEASGATVVTGDGYPGWPADANNPLLQKARETFESVLGYAPRVMAIHAGLECGVLKGKRPTLQMVSFGPDIFGAHTTNERIALDSVAPFYACLTGLLRDLCDVRL